MEVLKQSTSDVIYKKIERLKKCSEAYPEILCGFETRQIPRLFCEKILQRRNVRLIFSEFSLYIAVIGVR